MLKLFRIFSLIFIFFWPQTISAQTSADWYMSGGNPQRTSWVSEEAKPSGISWLRPIEAYIPQNVNLIAVNGKVYVATARGLYVLDGQSGELVWRYDSDLPMGNSPTVYNGFVYIGGYDKKLHVFRENSTGSVSPVFSFSFAKAGYDTNPLVIRDGANTNGKTMIFAGSRDGNMYAFSFDEQSLQGTLEWRYSTGEAIHLSAAYRNGIIYFASNNNYAYALRASNGSLVWKSAKLPGDGFQTYWPVIYNDKVIFPTNARYRTDLDPGSRTVDAPEELGVDLGDLRAINSTILGDRLPAQSWSNGKGVLDMGRMTEYTENNPQRLPYQHKPWRRNYVILNTSDGSEYTFDSDGDGYGEYMPIAYYGTKNGTRYPPVVGADNKLYAVTGFYGLNQEHGYVVGWNFGTKYVNYFSLLHGDSVETMALSGGGNLIYRNHCCDRYGDYESIYAGGGTKTYWSENIGNMFPGYDPMWFIVPRAMSRHLGWYKGIGNSVNGLYHNHGQQSPLIPHRGQIFTHRSNTIIAMGGSQRGVLPPITVNPSRTPATISGMDVNYLKSTLESEVVKIISASGFLRTAYHNARVGNYFGMADYFENPGDTLLALSRAYPHLSQQVQGQLRTYLSNYYNRFFNDALIADVGWIGEAPESMPLPDDLKEKIDDPSNASIYGAKTSSNAFASVNYYPHNLYSLYKYAQNVATTDRLSIYNKAKETLNRLPSVTNVSDTVLRQRPYEHNSWITGMIGFLKLQELVGMQSQDAQLRLTVTNNLNNLLARRWQLFSKDDVEWEGEVYYKKLFSVAKNFLFLSPDSAEYYRQNILSQVTQAINEYEYVAPYWFVQRFESALGEGAIQHLWNSPAMFSARAWILQEPREKLLGYLDAPAFGRGDLFFIDNLVTTIEAPSSSGTSSPTPTPRPGDANADGRIDGIDYIIWTNHFGQNSTNGNRDGDFDGSGRIDNLDYQIWLANYW